MPIAGTTQTPNQDKEYVEASIPIRMGGGIEMTISGEVQSNELEIDSITGKQKCTISVAASSGQKVGEKWPWTRIYYYITSNNASQEAKGANETNAVKFNKELPPGVEVDIRFVPSVGEDGNPRQYTKNMQVDGREQPVVFSTFGGYVKIIEVVVHGNEEKRKEMAEVYAAKQAEREATKAAGAPAGAPAWASGQKPAAPTAPTAPAAPASVAPVATEAPPPASTPPVSRWRRPG
jgi:hypothetical protein